MESDQTNIQKTFELINQLNGHVTFITVKVAYLTSTRQINISKAITDIHSTGFNLQRYLLFYLDNTKRLYVHIGTFPFPKQYQLLLKFELFLETTIKLRFRKISGPNSPKNEKKPLAPSMPNKRTRKEKTIQQVQELVSKWRNLYECTDENGKKIYTLDSAAEKLGMQKKTLDDYYYKIKSAHAYGFDFEKLKNDKIGVLRKFVKEAKQHKQQQPVPTPVFNQWLNIKPNQGFSGGFQNPLGGGTSYASSSYPMSYPPQKPSEDDIDKYFANDWDEEQSSGSEQSQ